MGHHSWHNKLSLSLPLVSYPAHLKSGMLAHLLQHSSAEAVVVCSIVVPPRLRSLLCGGGDFSVFKERFVVEREGRVLGSNCSGSIVEHRSSEIGSLCKQQKQHARWLPLADGVGTRRDGSGQEGEGEKGRGEAHGCEFLRGREKAPAARIGE